MTEFLWLIGSISFNLETLMPGAPYGITSPLEARHPANALQALADPNPRPADHPDRFTAPDTCSAAAIVLPRGPARTRRLMTSKPHRRGISGATYVPPSDGRSVLCGDGRSRTVENHKRASKYPCDRLDGRGALAGPEPAPVHACATVGPEVTLVPRSAPPWTLVQPHAT